MRCGDPKTNGLKSGKFVPLNGLTQYNTLNICYMQGITELENRMHTILETYSNVHRGSGHYSLITTRLYEKSREAVLNYLNLDPRKHRVIFCPAYRAGQLLEQLPPDSVQVLHSSTFGLGLGVSALVATTAALSRPLITDTGGGTARLTGPDWILWSKSPDRYEAGTPPIVNCIAFALALQEISAKGEDLYRREDQSVKTAEEILYQDEFTALHGPDLLAALRKTRIGYGHSVPCIGGNKPYINLDNAASTPCFQPVWEAFRQTWNRPAAFRQAIIREVNGICRDFFDAPETEYTLGYTSNTTEAINRVAANLASVQKADTEMVIVNSLLEHTSNDLPWRFVPGATLLRLAIDSHGFLSLEALETLLREYNEEQKHGRKRIQLVAITGASNVLGTCNDMQAISRLVHAYGAYLLVDGAQWVAHRPVSLMQSGIDYLVFSAHKLYAPFGTGVLFARKGLQNVRHPDYQAWRASAETNAGGIAALGKMLVLMKRIGMDVIEAEEQQLLKSTLMEMNALPGITLHGSKNLDFAPGLARTGVISFEMKKRMSDKLAQELAIRGGIGTRFGCHCSHILVKHLIGFKPALEKIQKLILILFPGLALPGLTRISIGLQTTPEELKTFLETLREISSGTRKPSAERQQEVKNARKMLEAFVEEKVTLTFNPVH